MRFEAHLVWCEVGKHSTRPSNHPSPASKPLGFIQRFPGVQTLYGSRGNTNASSNASHLAFRYLSRLRCSACYRGPLMLTEFVSFAEMACTRLKARLACQQSLHIEQTRHRGLQVSHAIISLLLISSCTSYQIKYQHLSATAIFTSGELEVAAPSCFTRLCSLRALKVSSKFKVSSSCRRCQIS